MQSLLGPVADSLQPSLRWLRVQAMRGMKPMSWQWCLTQSAGAACSSSVRGSCACF